jgi:glycosyltransferase involved in cell wall biosynthesis
MAPSPKLIRILVASEPGLAGVKRQVIDYLSEMDLEGFEILLVYSLVRHEPAYVEELQRLKNRGIGIHELPMSGSISPWRDLQGLLGAMRLILQFRPDIIHAHSSKAGFLFRAAARLVRSKARVIYTPHAMACYFSRFFRFIEQAMSPLTDLFIAVSASEGGDIVRWSVAPSEKIEVLTMGVHPARLPRTFPKERIITACGRICRQKNPLLFFQAMSRVAESDPEIRFRWIGSFSDDWESREVAALLAASPHRDRFEITGWVPDPETFLREAVIFCMLSRYESFGYVTADAMLLEIPIIGVDASGTRDLVQSRQTGLLVEPQPEALTSAVMFLLNNPELARQWSRAGKHFVENTHSVGRMCAQMRSIYHRSVTTGNA